MAYFPNGTAGEVYEYEYCNHCIHQKPDEGGCAVWLAHMVHNYEECNKKDSILHILIPMSKDGPWADECKMFVRKPPK